MNFDRQLEIDRWTDLRGAARGVLGASRARGWAGWRPAAPASMPRQTRGNRGVGEGDRTPDLQDHNLAL